MPALRIVEHLDIIKDVTTSFLPVVAGFPLDTFPLPQQKETLYHRAIVAIAPDEVAHIVF